MRLASRFGLTHSIRQERPLTNDELVKVVPSVFSEEKHNSRSDRSGKDTVLPPHPPLRTVLASFPAHGSSLSKHH
ncbi:hypothetical protein DWV81_25590 [Escherichia coli]|nr:hypothetical protein DWV81_25590 [Escherichia coli]